MPSFLRSAPFATPPASCHSEFACEFRHHARSACPRDGSYEDLVVKDSGSHLLPYSAPRRSSFLMQPDQAKFLLDFLLRLLKSEKAITKKILFAVPADQGNYQPHPKSMTSLKLSRHLASTEMWFLDAVIDHVFKE